MATNPTNVTTGGTTSSTLSEWAGPYVTGMLGQTQALAQQPYQVYQGPLTAGVSPLQQQAFQGIGALKTPTSMTSAASTAGGIAQQAGGMAYSPTTFTNQFQAPTAYTPTDITTQQWGTQAAQQYMNPYLQTALQPQMQELTRQADIARLTDAARLGQAGAYGGSRQAIMDAEARRNLMGKQSDVLAQGYKTAYDVGQQAFMTDQQRALAAQQAAEQSKQFGATQGMTAAQQAAQYGLAGQQATEASKQFGAQYGLDALSRQLQAAQAQGALGQAELKAQQDILTQLAQAGAAQRAIEGEGITADYNEFLQQRDYPMKMLQFQQSMLQGMPISTQTSTPQTSALTGAMQTAGGLMDLYSRLFGSGSTKTGT